MSELEIGAVNHFQTNYTFFALNYTFLHSITLFCTDLGLIDHVLNQSEYRNCFLYIIKTVIKVVLAGDTVLMVTYCVTKMITMCLPMDAWAVSDTTIEGSSDKECSTNRLARHLNVFRSGFWSPCYYFGVWSMFASK